MSEITKPIMLDETGKEIVAAILSTDVAQKRIAEINTAAEAAKADVLASIPEDYTNLVEEVSQLSEEIDELRSKKMVSVEVEVNRIKTLTNTKSLACELTSITIPDGVESVTVTTSGKNLLDTSVLSGEVIKNDNGEEIYDYTSGYYVNMIPVVPDETLYINFGAQRIYQYGADKQWLRRTAGSPDGVVDGVFTVPSDCYYIQIQINRRVITDIINYDKMQIEVGRRETAYEAPRRESVVVTADTVLPIGGLRLHDGTTRIVCDAVTDFTIVYQMEDTSVEDAVEKVRKLEITIPECPAYPIWLCDSSTDEHQTAIGQNSATCSLSYVEFLAQYFDCYITNYADRYSVTKKSLGRDSANKYYIYEYTFTPKRYSRTVMLSGGMNASELPAEFGIAYFIKNVMEKTDASFAWLHDNVRFKVIPVICPWSFDQSPLKYENFNGVNLNKNFDYNHSWDDYSAGGAGTKGDAPCSEAETKMLLRWINSNANKCDLWIDCHTDSAGIAEDATANLHAVICSDSATTNLIKTAQKAITQAYVAAGYFASGAEKTGSVAWTEGGGNYPKTLYARHICGIPSIMVEQYVGNPYYGGTKTIANTSADINNYVTMLRAYVLSVLERDSITFKSDDIAWYIYQMMMDNHFITDDTETVGDILAFSHGGFNGDGTLTNATNRAHSDFIKVPDSGVFTVTNMGDYALVDVAAYTEDRTFIKLTSGYSKTENGNDWMFTINDLSSVTYVRFSVKLADGSNGEIKLADFFNATIKFD